MSMFESAGNSAYRNVTPSIGNRISNPDKSFNQDIIYNSFSGTDITAIILLPNEDSPLVLGELQTFSYSIHRENTPVRTLGHTNVRGFVKGPRTIAGSMIWYQFNQYTFYRLKQYMSQISAGLYATADMLPPFDMVLSFANEYGMFAKMKVFGMTMVDEGGTMSVDDMVTEQTWTYMARGIQPLTAYIPNEYGEQSSTSQSVAKTFMTFGSRPF